MRMLKKIVSTLMLPPASLLVAAFLGLALAAAGRPTGLALAGLALAGLWIVATPRLALTLARRIESTPALDLEAATSSQAIVVLGLGYTASSKEYGGRPRVRGDLLVRLQHAAYLHRETQLPILVTGGDAQRGGHTEAEVMKDTLQASFGCPTRWMEQHARDTWENARLSREILKAEGIDRVVLVTHAFDAPRSVETFARFGFEVQPAPVAFMSDERLAFPRDLLPDAHGLRIGHLLAYEALGRLYYWLRRASKG